MSALQVLEERLQGRLERLKQKSRFRELRTRAGIDLSSNDYLGLADHPQIRKAMESALADGILLGATGSRLLRGNAPEHQLLEQQLADLLGTEAALIFNSGYDANVGLLSTLCGPPDKIFSDALVHASMIDGIRGSQAERIVFQHNDMAHLEQLLQEHQGGRSRFILVESVYSMDGDLAPLKELERLADQYEALLIVDEAHGTGLFGPRGAGRCVQEGIKPFISMHTCGKAWGSFGAFVGCSAVVQQYLVNNCRRFIFTTAIPPLLTIQWSAALAVIDAEGWRAEKTLAMAETFRKALAGKADTGSSQSQIVPLICGSDATALAAAEFCQRAGFDIRAIRPPTVPLGTARLRIAFNARLTEADLDSLIGCCRLFLEGNP